MQVHNKRGSKQPAISFPAQTAFRAACCHPDRTPDWNIGYTTRSHLCLDLDNTSHYKVRNLVLLLMQQYHFLGDAIILESSTGNLTQKWQYPPLEPPRLHTKRANYHVVFSNFIPYEMSCKIIENLAYLGVLNEEYVRIREMRNDMTLRVSKTVNTLSTKSPPKFLEYIQNKHSNRVGKGIYLYNRLRKCF